MSNVLEFEVMLYLERLLATSNLKKIDVPGRMELLLGTFQFCAQFFQLEDYFFQWTPSFKEGGECSLGKDITHVLRPNRQPCKEYFLSEQY